MNEKLLRPYSPKETEDRIYKLWEESGFFNPDICVKKGVTGKDAEPFSIVLPPPNVTGMLHLGHAFEDALQDAFVRFARMRGKKTLWIPGTDSAAIATQARVEKDIYKKEGKNRHDLGRDELISRVEKFAEESESTILNQVKKMGASLDWSRYAYTLDEKRNKAVTRAFVNMYNADLIYRGNRIVNWDPKGQTTISDDEVVHEERDTTLYTFRYWKDFPISISTTRPETKVGDTAVAVHPKDNRYKKFIGKTFTGEFAGTTLTLQIVADEAVDKEFGTGAVGVTPAHSYTDYEIAERHNIPRHQVINEYAKMTEEAGTLVAGLKTTEAREKIVTWLREKNLLEKEEKIKHNISISERTGGIIEPLPKLQWFINVNKPFVIPYSEIPGIGKGEEITLKELMRRAVAQGGVGIWPERFQKSYFHWTDNLHDWCISRQIWFGHRIPVWYKDKETYVGIEKPKGKEWTQDPDVLDTWFSSALWTFSTLGWPEKTEDLKTYHPTTLMLPGYEILFLWVSRMILMSVFHLGQIPFKQVVLHGIVRDKQGRKFSKSLGNGIDPLDMIEKYGTDALRIGLLAGTAPGNDVKFDENKIKGYKHFANKLWNIARFVLSNTEDSFSEKKPKLTDHDTTHVKELARIVDESTKHVEAYRLDLAVDVIYHFVWHQFADVYLETAKPILKNGTDEEKKSTAWTLNHTLKISLGLLHPFMPFITEEIWSMIPKKDKKLLMVSAWPESDI